MKINHQICSLEFKLTIPSKEAGFDIQERLNTLCQENILKFLEESFHQIDQPDVLIRIDRLELDLGIVNLESFEANICEKLAENLDDYLAKIQDHSGELNTNISQTSLAINPLEHLSYFLKTGQLPWNAKPEIFQDFDALILNLLDKNPDGLKQLWQQTLNQTNARQRLIFNLQESTLERLLITSMQWTENSWQNLKKVISFLSKQLTQVTVSSAEKLWQWDNFIQMLANSIPIDIQVGFEKWLEEKMDSKSFISWASKPQIWSNFKNAVNQYLLNQSPPLPSWLENSLNNHLDKIEQQFTFSSLPMVKSKDISRQTQQSQDIWDDKNDQKLESQDSFPPKSSRERPSVDFRPLDIPVHQVQNLSSKQRENPHPNSSKSSQSSSSNLNTPSKQHKQQVFPETFPFKNEKAYFIRNSGLVLLWPYLPRYLEALNYVQNNQFISPHHQLQAIHALEHLVRGKEDYREYDLVLNKVLLSLPLSTPIDPELGKICFQPQEVNQLLETAIGYWTILGNTSVDGFRQSFLKREGKLIAEENNWKLIVNRKGYDILLEKLPYPLYCLKLSWMNQPLYLEW